MHKEKQRRESARRMNWNITIAGKGVKNNAKMLLEQVEKEERVVIERGIEGIE